MISAKGRYMAEKCLYMNSDAKSHIRDYRLDQVQSDSPETIELDKISTFSLDFEDRDGLIYRIYLTRKLNTQLG